MDSTQILYTVFFTLIMGLATVSRIMNETMDVMNTGIILVLRAVGRHSDVRRGEDEHSWARYLCRF